MHESTDLPTSDSLFDRGESGWKLEILVKVGGGPFDPSGFSVTVVRPNGTLAAAVVHSCQSSRHQNIQLADLLKLASHFAKVAHDNPGKAQTLADQGWPAL
jgi:hypothetical protein